MENLDLSGAAWDNRYKNEDTGWDLGSVSPPLKAYIDQLENKNQRILIPGGGNSYEAEYLFTRGFQNVFVVDVSETALHNFQRRVPDFPADQLIHKDFFDIKDSFDLILEQTFFCALFPKLRKEYAIKVHEILTEKGKLVGLLFDAPLFANRPPFGGSKKEYTSYFSPYFNFKIYEPCYNSHPSRRGKELFINLIKI